MGNSTLEERIQRLEDIESIKQLKVRYSHIFDCLLYTSDAADEG